MHRNTAWLWFVLLTLLNGQASRAEPLKLQLRSQAPILPENKTFQTIERAAEWEAAQTALIVCDVWDYHHSANAARRLGEFAPRLNAVITKARESGVVIIHAPSDCLPAYVDHPARQRAQSVAVAKNLPAEIDEWCSIIPTEKNATYPLDQSDGGSDDDPQEHAEWVGKLAALGRNPGLPWRKQNDAISIDGERDFISDRGSEVWNILEARGIRHVILTGVHVNMCVLGRPFGLRRMVLGGKEAVLLSDLTDTMYNPAAWPYVNHFTGNDLIVEHIERYVCPTITSDQLLGGEAFRFSGDDRTRVAVVVAGDQTSDERMRVAELRTTWNSTCKVDEVSATSLAQGNLAAVKTLERADVGVLAISADRLTAPAQAAWQRFLATGRGLIVLDAGARSATTTTTVRVAAKMTNSPLLTGIARNSTWRVPTNTDTLNSSPDKSVILEGVDDRGRVAPLAWLQNRPGTGAPPMFLVHAQDDRVTPASSVLLFTKLKQAGIPCELHVYASGGHGFGMRDTGEPVNSWPERCAAWLSSQGWLKSK